MSLKPGTLIHNRYRVVKSLSQGGFGAIYRAWDTVLGRPMALKENLDTSPEAQRQFEREARILADLSHPNLPRVTDYFFIPGQGQYLVMDFVQGQDLQDMLERRGQPLPETQVLPWIDQVCDALAYLHAQNPPIIHRDIKPANIQITSDGRVVLVDFGIAKYYDPAIKTTQGARAVTPGYSPHEQYGQGITDARSDIYALGATLYTLLTGEEPPESIDRVVRDPLVAAEQINPSISKGIIKALDRALQVDPERRYHSISELKLALKGERNLHQSASPRLGPSGPATAAQAVQTRPGIPKVWVISIAVLLTLLVVLVLVVTFRQMTPPGIVATSPVSSGISGDIPQTPTNNIGVPTRSHLQTPTPQSVSAPMLYLVQPGDTCTTIARRYGLSMNDLIVFNRLSTECLITAGQRLLLPTQEQISLPANSATPAVQIAQVDGMEIVQIPAGIFWMGASPEDFQASEDEKPGHWIYLDEFWLDRTEVSNAKYALCVQAGECQTPMERGSETRLPYYGNPVFGDYPVVFVSWEDAWNYCHWVGRRLPTEAEWEKAARGLGGQTFPWGDAPPTPRVLNFNNHVGDTTPVGSYPEGAGPYGVLDMAGNVQEWVADLYNAQYYRFSPVEVPLGPVSGDYRVLRGGSWFSSSRAVRSAFRNWNFPDQGNGSSGFRCAR